MEPKFAFDAFHDRNSLADGEGLLTVHSCAVAAHSASAVRKMGGIGAMEGY
jgi:hypothetical protein